MSCNICQSNSKIKFEKHGVQLHECKNCGFVFVFPPPSLNTQIEFYDKHYSGGAYYRYTTAKELKTKTSEKRLEEFSKYAQVGRLLDVGCSTGFFLDVCLLKGYETYGVELSEEAVKKANKIHKIFNGDLENAKFEDEFFDVITMYDLIEHVLDPNKLLNEANRILKKNGLLIITTPDISSWHAKIMGKHWGMITPFEHLLYFSPKTMTMILEKNGFSMVQLRKNFKIFAYGYMIEQTDYFYPRFHKLAKYFLKILPKNFLNKYREVYVGEMFVIARKQ